ncbi:MAG: hypothetical protein IJY42_05520 [Clostridia bacterium]|nr:hypothetical protein [Clostridia bacterium]MBQ8415826.1 hypothetical protein [Clostridia bacterium]
MARHRRFNTPQALERAWEAYKKDCNARKVKVHGFCTKEGRFVTEEVEKAVTYTIEGFCVWAKIPRSAFYETYAESERFSDMVSHIREECEVDARDKFELGLIPTQLSGLWMSKYGYSLKPKDSGSSEVRVVFDASDGVEYGE